MKNIIIKITIINILLLFNTFSFSQLSESQSYKLTQVLDNITRYYTDSVDGNKIVETAIKNTLKELDPHSTYFNKEEVDELNRNLEGSFDGIGIMYTIMNDTVFVISITADGPSEKAGILPGDRIIYVENDPMVGVQISTKKVKDKLLGKKGSNIKISVKRRGINSLLDFTIVRDKITISSIDAAYMATKDVGYIKLERFSATTTDDFDDAVKKLKKLGAENFILDLRDNGGGYLNTAVDITERFLGDDKMIVYTEGVKSQKKIYKSNSRAKLKDSRLVILVDEGSASASEIVSGAIQDWDRGVIVGRRSFGKGLVQRPFFLIDGSMIRLTIARYYTPCGRSIQKSYSHGKDEYKEDIEKRIKHGEMTEIDSIKFNDSLQYLTLENKRKVFGGGGIMPDVFVPLDTAIYPEFYKTWIQSGDIQSFIHLFVDNNRNFFKSNYNEFEKFKKDYLPNKTMIEELKKYVLQTESKNKKFKYDSENDKNLFENSNISTHLKALIANDLWNTQEYYSIMNENSKVYRKAIEIIENLKKYNDILAVK